MQINLVMTSYTQPSFDQIWWKKISQPIFIRNVSFFCSKIQLNVFYNFIPMATYWVPDLPNIKRVFGHPLHSIFIFANGAWHTWSNKHINVLAWVCDLVYRFSSWKSLTCWNQVGGDWKRMSCHGNNMFYSLRCVFCRTISLPSFNDLRCNLAKIATFTQMM